MTPIAGLSDRPLRRAYRLTRGKVLEVNRNNLAVGFVFDSEVAEPIDGFLIVVDLRQILTIWSVVRKAQETD